MVKNIISEQVISCFFFGADNLFLFVDVSTSIWNLLLFIKELDGHRVDYAVAWENQGLEWHEDQQF